MPDLLLLGRAFADPVNDLCVLSEGNVSCRGRQDTFWVKGSGVQMAGLSSTGVVEVSASRLLSALDAEPLDETAVRSLLNSSRVDPRTDAVPSTESFMHAYLLSLQGVRFVGHGHPTPLLSLLCLAEAESIASKRLFPDEIVLCGPEACYVPYVAPGLPLAVEIRAAVGRYSTKWNALPKTIWMQNHGLICLGETPRQVLAAAQMSVKAARVTLGALQSGREVSWLTSEQISQIHNWQDEHYRSQLLR